MGLAIYIVRTENQEFWAGWLLGSSPCRDPGATALLQKMLPASPERGYAGFVTLQTNTLFMDESDAAAPFYTVSAQTPPIVAVQVPPVVTTQLSKAVEKPKQTKKQLKTRIRSEEEITKSLFEEDEDLEEKVEEQLKEVIQKIRKRNTKAIKDLKDLYKGKCQLTGDEYSFKKKDGSLYCEAHHLIPLGNEGADSPFNIIIVNPLIHRMLHYAEVSEINLSNISAKGTLDITISGKTYSITWHPDHAENVKKHKAD
jgi:5-methylcytosine-specific restriction protein A